MELQFQSRPCRCLKAAAREVRNMELTQEVRLSDGMPDIGRVISSWGQIILRSKEWQGDQTVVSGGIMVWTIYAPEDGTPVRSVDAWVPFQLKWDLRETAAEGPIRIYPLIRFVDSRGVSPRKMMIRAGIAAMGEMLSPEQIQIYDPVEIPPDIQLLRNTYPVRLPKEAGEKILLLDEDLQIHPGMAQPERILGYTWISQLQEKRVTGDKIVVKGTGRIRLLYRCSEGRVHSEELELPFAQYAQLEDTYGNDAQADVMMGVTNLEIIQNEGAQLRVKCGLLAQYLVADRCLVEVSEDAYSPRREVELNIEELKLPSILEQRTEALQVQQQIAGVAADVVDVCCLPDFPRQNRSGDRMLLEIPGQFQLLYYTPEGVLQGANVRWESSLQFGADKDSQMMFLIQPPDQVRIASAAEGLHLACQIKLEMQAYAQEGIPMLTGLNIGQMEEPDPARPSLILCRSNGDDLWSIAKRCGSTVDDLKRLNHLDVETIDNRMLLIPVS